MKAIVKYLVIAFILTIEHAQGQIKLPRLISDGAVLQRETPLTLWGWASAMESVTLTFQGNTYHAQADAQGNWKILLPAQSAGGPHDLRFKGNTEIVIKNIVFGDVWVCSGQSNMELTMERVKEKYSALIANSENTDIRQFLVPDRYDFHRAHTDLENGTWETVSPLKILPFSAVAYFFAKELYDKYHVPIGLINAALGGSPAEAWISEEALIKFPKLYEEAQQFKDDKLIAEIETNDRMRINTWYSDLAAKDEGLLKWRAANVEDHDWSEMNVPGYWADEPLGNIHGAVWFRKKITVSKSMTGRAGKLWLGRLVDADSVFINGKLIGTTTYQYPPRRYEFSTDVLKEGENSIVVKIINSAGRGGFVPGKPYYLAVGRDTIDLKGAWRYKLGVSMPSLQGSTAIRFKPAGLYNSMIAPLLKYSIKGVIWYQGESNTERYKEYEDLFPALIRNWREKWNQGEFPFLYVQLANFMEPQAEPAESNWAALRQAQLKTLAMPNTGMAVTIDVGEANDIHPLDKQTVGRRLALIAQSIAYRDKNIVYAGPMYQTMKISGNQVELRFSGVGHGLTARGGDLKYFAIAGADRKFVWAKAKIKDNHVIVWSDDVKHPVMVRYAWADNPEGANLYNKEGLPASPFTTENE